MNHALYYCWCWHWWENDTSIRCLYFSIENSQHPRTTIIAYRHLGIVGVLFVTADGNFTVKSTYRVQFWGACIPERLGSIWKAKVENKYRFFTWLILQDRLPTADRIIGRGGQANHTCQICKTGVESSFRMIVACSFSLRVWDQIAQHNNFQMAQAPVQPTLTAWWKNLSQSSQTEPKEHI